jgi:hypothetical protein
MRCRPPAPGCKDNAIKEGSRLALIPRATRLVHAARLEQGATRCRRRNRLVDTLLERIRPVVERLAMDLALIAAARIERELGRLGEAVEVALSTYASDRPDLITAALGPELAAMLTPPKETHADPDRGDHDPVPHVRRGSGRGLHDDGLETEGRARRGLGRTESGPHKRRLRDAKKVSELLDW